MTRKVNGVNTYETRNGWTFTDGQLVIVRDGDKPCK
jgi:hypothetical protein